MPVKMQAIRQSPCPAQSPKRTTRRRPIRFMIVGLTSTGNLSPWGHYCAAGHDGCSTTQCPRTLRLGPEGGHVAFDRELTPALCAAGGLLLLAWGIGRRGGAGIAAAGLGGWLVYQAGVRINRPPLVASFAAEAAETGVVDEAMLIAATPDSLYRFCRDLAN